MRCSAIFVVTLALAACVPAARPAPEPVRAVPVVALPPPPAADWRDRPANAGDWAYRRDARGSIALFGNAGADATVTLRCDIAARRVYLSRAGVQSAALSIRTSTASRTLAVQPTGGQPAYVAAAFAPNDALLDAIAFSRGRFVVEQPGAPTLVIPAWPEIGRVIEDCRG
ncbi:hypothetical protein [Sphingomonas sp.]|uniref:hypothetical protein n=1 Tax=Sphingomonas sp. TaxID=28214 RepID=UPI0035BC9497